MKKTILSYLFILFFLSASYCSAQQITLITRQDILPFKSFTEGFVEAGSKHIKNSAIRLNIYDIKTDTATISNSITDSDSDIIVCAGKASLSFIALHDISTPVIFSMVLPPFDEPVFNRPNLTGISMNASCEEKLKTIKKINNNIRRIGAVYDPSQSETAVNETFEYAGREGFSLQAVPVNTPPMAIKAIGKIFSDCDAFLLFVDRTALTSTAIEYIFQCSFKHNVPVIGLSEKYTRLGALFSIETVPEQLGRQAWELCLEYLKGAGIKEGIIKSAGPFKLSINNTVARKMGIKISEDILQKAYTVY